MSKSKTKPVRRMWASQCLGEYCVYRTKAEAEEFIGDVPTFLMRTSDEFHPVYVVDARPEAMEALVEKVARAIAMHAITFEAGELAARAVLASIFPNRSKGAK